MDSQLHDSIAVLLHHSEGCLVFTEGKFVHAPHSKDKCQNRETLARFYTCLKEKQDAKRKDICSLRSIFNQLLMIDRESSLPKVIKDDVFLTKYAMGSPLLMTEVRVLWNALDHAKEMTSSQIEIHYHAEGRQYYNVNATPPGLFPKLFSLFRLKADKEMLHRVRSDLRLAANIEDNEKRMALTFALLSFSAAYRELDNQVLAIPHMSKPGYLVPYHCRQHLIATGLKTVSLSAGQGYPAIYLCQGTEIWPSQPYTLDSILANFAEHGSASQAYAHSWRRIHKQLRDLKEQTGSFPIVIGHSMGGSLALQIALFSHDLIASAHAYNPPAAGQRDFLFYQSLPSSIKKKCNVYANIDDPVFWQIGAQVIGNVTLFLGKQRWRYHAITKLDTIFIIPAVIKIILNIIHVFPAHQKILSLCENYVTVTLSEEELAIENKERVMRFDYLHFLPKLYHPLHAFILLIRKIFKWRLEEEFLRNEIEILALHERDLIDTETDENREEVKKKLISLAVQKAALQRKLFSL